MQSKTANIWMASQLEERFGSQQVHAWSLNPGFVRTGLPRSLVDVKPEEFYKKIEANEPVRLSMKDIPQGAATSVWAAISPEFEAGKNGGMYLEDIRVATPSKPDAQATDNTEPGYLPHAYDKEGAKALWEYSEKILKAVPA